jgi:uracil-DNA glycosylase family 4
MSEIRVPGAGHYPNDIMLVGEAPGREEARALRPFVGISGYEQYRYLEPYGINPNSFYKTNVVSIYREGNPDPTPELIFSEHARLQEEIDKVQPKLITAVGRFAMRRFLGDGANLDSSRGLAHNPYCLTKKTTSGIVAPKLRLPKGCIVLPTTHPAAGLHNSDFRSLIADDYYNLSLVVEKLRTGQRIQTIDTKDRILDPVYLDVSGKELKGLIESYTRTSKGVLKSDLRVAIDTEGTPKQHWSIQVCFEYGVAFCLRSSRKDFHVGIKALQRLANTFKCLFIAHNWMWDLAVCRAMGLDLSCPYIKLFDTMYGLYVLRNQPQSLKSSAFRLTGMRMTEYESLLEGIGFARQVTYLRQALERSLKTPWNKPEPYTEIGPDGQAKQKKPSTIERRIKSILTDYDNGKVTKQGPVNPFKRWMNVPRRQRIEVRDDFGPMPQATLDDVSREDAIYYACRDPDATLRVYDAQLPLLKDEDPRLYKLACEGSYLVPFFEEMQATGMPASVNYFVDLAEKLSVEVSEIRERISTKFFRGKPFNPRSAPHVRELMRLRGLTGTKRTKKGDISTAKTSIEHLRYTDEAIKDVFEARERAHIKSSFCQTAITAALSEELGANNYSEVLEALEDIKDYPNYSEGEIPISSFIKSSLEYKTSDTDEEELDEENEDSYHGIDCIDKQGLVRVRCQIRNTRTHTRRLGASKPNLLAIPARTDIGKLVREGYQAPEGYVFATWDLSQIEMRCMANESRDELLIRFFVEDRDIHRETAARVWKIALDEVTDKQRNVAKTINFGLAYGQMAPGLQTQLWMKGLTQYTLRDCDELSNKVLGVFPGIKRYFKKTGEEARKHPRGLVSDRYGMRRYLPGVHSNQLKVRAEAERHAVSQKIQGMAQGVIQRAMKKLRALIWEMQRGGLDIQLLLTVHDELLMLIPEDLFPVLDPIVKRAFVTSVGFKMLVPILSSGTFGTTWGSLKG